MKRWTGLVLLAGLFLLAEASTLHSQATPNVTLTGKIQGPNGLPAANNILSFTPTQSFYVGGQGAICSSYVIQFTGAPVICADILNFNSTTPAAPPNGLNVNWSVTRNGITDNITGAIVGDGQVSDCLSGIGTWVACGGGGGGGVPTGVANGSNLVSNGVGANPVYQPTAIVDVRNAVPAITPAGTVNCSRSGSVTGCVDSYSALQSFFTAQCPGGTYGPGPSIVMPQTTSISQGIDYYSSQGILLPRGCHVEGVGTGRVGRATTIRFAAGQPGFICQSGCVIKHFFLLGGNTYTSGSIPTIANADGIQAGSSTIIEDVLVQGFGRHGLMAASDLASGFSGWPTQFDAVTTIGVVSNDNLGDGFHFSGGDGGTGTEIDAEAYSNQGTGIVDTSLYGNAWVFALTTGNGRSYNSTNGKFSPAPYSESDVLGGNFCNGGVCASLYNPTGATAPLSTNGVIEDSENWHKRFYNSVFVIPTRSAVMDQSGDAANVATALSYDPDFFGQAAFTAFNINPTNPNTILDGSVIYSSLLLRRNFSGSGNNGNGNGSNWWSWQIPGNPDLGNGNMPTTDIALADNLTDSQRSSFSGKGGVWIPNYLCLGQFPSPGNFIAPNCISSGTAAPTTGSWKVGDMVINQSPTAGGIWAWRNVIAGTPGTWEALRFSGGFTGNPWYDITLGAVCDGTTDASAVLQANLTAAAGGFAYIPALKQCETSVTLTLPTNLQGFWIGPGAQLQASATITGHGVIEQGGIGQRATNPEIYGGGVIDANGKADYVAWFHNFAGLRIHDLTLKGSNVDGLELGDVAASFSDNAWVHHVWVDRPGAASIPSGSIGIHITNAGDSESIDNNTIISYDRGIQVDGTNHWFAHNHVWSRLTFTQAFTDNGTGNHWESNEADSPGTYCFRLGATSNYATLEGNTCYNNSAGPDNVLVGIYVANAAPQNTIANNFFYGQSGSHRLAQDIQSPNGFTNIQLCGNQDLNVVTQNALGCGTGSGPGTGTTYAETFWSAATTLGSFQNVIVPVGSSSTVIQNILTAAVAGQKIQFSGSYSACSLTLSVANVSLIGLNTDGASIQCATASSPVLTISGAGDSISNINLKHITNSPTCPGGAGTSTCGSGLQVTGGATRVKISDVHSNFNYNGFDLGYTTYSEISNSISEFNNGDGINFVMDATHKNMQWQVSRVLSEQNLGNGFNMTCPNSFTSVQTPGPYISGWTIAYGNAGKGFKFSCSAATTSGISDVFIGNTFASQNNDSGFYFDLGPNGGRNLVVTGGYSEQAGTYPGTAGFSSATQTPTNVGHGVDITSSCDNTPAPNITGMTLWGNSYSGIHAACPGTSLTALNSYGNGAASANAQTESGIEIDATNVQVNGGYHRKGSTQTYGVYVFSGDTPSIVGPVCDSSISASNCIFSGTAPASGYQQRLGQTTITTTGSTNALTANGFVSGGTIFTSSGGLSETTLVGGATSGKFTTVGVTTGSTVVTMGSSATAPHGWACSALDITHPADVITASPTSATTITLTVASAITSGDVIQFGPCIAY